MCDGIHIVYFCRNERDHENVEVLYLTEREKKERKKNKTKNQQNAIHAIVIIHFAKYRFAN